MLFSFFQIFGSHFILFRLFPNVFNNYAKNHIRHILCIKGILHEHGQINSALNRKPGEKVMCLQIKLPPLKRMVVLALLTGMLASCMTVGRNFSSNAVFKIETGKTTREEMEALLGSPWRTGLEDGHKTITYGYYRYRLFKEPMTKDLVVRFDKKGKVISYTFNTTEVPKSTGVPKQISQ